MSGFQQNKHLVNFSTESYATCLKFLKRCLKHAVFQKSRDNFRLKNLGLPRESESFSILVSNANLRTRVQK